MASRMANPTRAPPPIQVWDLRLWPTSGLCPWQRTLLGHMWVQWFPAVSSFDQAMLFFVLLLPFWLVFQLHVELLLLACCHPASSCARTSWAVCRIFARSMEVLLSCCSVLMLIWLLGTWSLGLFVGGVYGRRWWFSQLFYSGTTGEHWIEIWMRCRCWILS